MHLLTITAAVSCTTHGISCAALSGLTAGQADASGIVAEFITSALFIVRANACLLRHDKNKSSVSLKYYDYSLNIRESNFCRFAQT